MYANPEHHYGHSPGGRSPQQQGASSADGTAAVAATSQPANNNSANADPSATAGAGAFGSRAPASAAKENRENRQRLQLDQQQSPFTSPARHTRKAPGTDDNGGEGAKKTPQSSKRRKMNPEEERITTSTPRLPPAATSAPLWSPSQNHQGRSLVNPNPFSPHPFSPSAAAPLPPPNAATAAPNAPGVQESSASRAPLVPTYQPHVGFPATTTQPGAPASGLTQPQARPTNTPGSSNNTESNGFGNSYLAPPPAPRDSGSPGDDGSFFSSTPSASSGSGLSSNMDSSPADDPTQGRMAVGDTPPPAPPQQAFATAPVPAQSPFRSTAVDEAATGGLGSANNQAGTLGGDGGAEPQQQELMRTGNYEERIAAFCAIYHPDDPHKFGAYKRMMAESPGFENDLLIRLADDLRQDPAIFGLGTDYCVRAVFEKYAASSLGEVDAFLLKNQEKPLRVIMVELANEFKFQPSEFGIRASRLFKGKSALEAMSNFYSAKFTSDDSDAVAEYEEYAKKLKTSRQGTQQGYLYREEEVLREIATKYKVSLEYFDLAPKEMTHYDQVPPQAPAPRPSLGSTPNRDSSSSGSGHDLGGDQNPNAGVADAKAEIVDLLRGAADNIDRAKSIAQFSMNESQRLAFLQRQVPDVLRGRIRNGASLLGGGNHRQDQDSVASRGGTTAMSISYAREDGAAMAGTLWNRMEDPEHCSVSREKLKNAGKLFKCTDAEECREKIYKMQLDEILGKLGELKKRRFQDSAPYILNLSYNKEIPQRHPIISDPKSDFWGMNDIEKKENIASWVTCMLLSPRFPVKIPDKLKARYQREYRGKKANGTW